MTCLRQLDQPKGHNLAGDRLTSLKSLGWELLSWTTKSQLTPRHLNITHALLSESISSALFSCDLLVEGSQEASYKCQLKDPLRK